MRKFVLNYLIPRFVQYIMVIFVGVTVVFIVPRLSPNDPVTTQIGLLSSAGGEFTPEMMDDMRAILSAMYGLEGSTWDQYVSLWKRLIKFDLGPSLSSFPTPVMTLIGRALPWTLRLLLTTTIFSWLLGNLLGGLASYYPDNRLIKCVDVFSQGVRPIPYYIMGLGCLILFAFIFPIFPYRGAYPIGVRPSMTLKFFMQVIRHSTLPAISMILVGFGGWFIGMKSLTSNIISEDYVVYAETAGLNERKILFGYVMRNALLPQVTALAMGLGMVFNGALMMEVVFTYPGMGYIMYQAIISNDYSLIIGITIFSIVGVATLVFILDLIYPLFDPRIRHQ